MEIHIQIDKLNVMTVESSSGIFSGENYHSNWSAMDKSNTGMNRIYLYKRLIQGGVFIQHDRKTCIRLLYSIME